MTRQARSRSPRASERGTAAVEFALVLPIVLAIVLALVQVAVESGDDAIRAAVLRAAPALEPSSVAVSTVRAGVRGEPVTVTVTYVAAIRVPFVAWLFPAGVSMRAEATDRQEFT